MSDAIHAYVWSTLSNDTKYAIWVPGGGDLKVLAEGVLIKGGANMATRHLVTPRGICTPVTEEQLDILNRDPIFKRHQARGYMKVELKQTKVEEAVSDMVQRDESSPLVPEDYNAEDAAEVKAPVTNQKTPPKPPKPSKAR